MIKCNCDAFMDDPCIAHEQENDLQNQLIELRNRPIDTQGTFERKVPTMKLYYAEVCVDYESSDFVGIYTTYQKCYDALVAFGRYGDSTYIYEMEADNSTPLRCWSMTNCRPYVDPLVPNFVPARNYQTKDFVHGKAEDYQGQLDTPKQSV